MTQMAPQQMEQLEAQDGTATIHIQQAHQAINPQQQQQHQQQQMDNSITSTANNIQTGFLEAQTSGTQMTMSNAANVYPQTAFIIPQGTSTEVSAFIPRGTAVTHQTGQTVTANIQQASQHYIAAPTHTIPMPTIQMGMSQHQQQQQQAQSQPLFKISAMPQQT